jgi:hypothetical protein
MNEWSRYDGGFGWRYDSKHGVIFAAQEPQGEARLVTRDMHGGLLYRTAGEPGSMRQLWLDYRSIILEASERFNLRPHFIMACIGIEATRLKTDRMRIDRFIAWNNDAVEVLSYEHH